MSRTLRPLAAFAMLALMVAGCSSTSAGTGSSGGNSTASTHRRAVKFAECMRNNGVSAFPDPDASGELTIDAVANSSSVDTNFAAFEHALRACRDLEPPGFTGHERNAQEQEAALKFAQCIRDNGVKDFPDPAPGEPLVDTNRIPSAATTGGMSIPRCRSAAASGRRRGRRGANDAEALGAGRSGRPGCRNRHRRRGRHVQCEASDRNTGAAGEHRDSSRCRRCIGRRRSGPTPPGGTGAVPATLSSVSAELSLVHLPPARLGHATAARPVGGVSP